MSLPITLSIERGTYTITVRGARSRKGWNIFRTDGAEDERLGHRKAKEEALRFAQDCCEPGVVGAVFLVTPAT